MIDYRVYLVTDDPSRYSGDWLENVVAAVEGGVTCVQYRDTENPPKVQYERLLRLKDALSRHPVPIIVNNDAELAAAVKSEGIHVGQHDLSVAETRSIVGNRCEIGLSITAVEQVSALRLSGAVMPDVLGIGPIFDATKTKADASAAMGTGGLAEIANMTQSFRNVAIGGINLDNARSVLSAGAGGLAVVSAFSKSSDPYLTAKHFSELF